jgi:LPXTG-site transpeptidase (sortase) family protein
MLKKLILISLSVLISILVLFSLTVTNKNTIELPLNISIIKKEKENSIGTLTISKINLKQKLYEINSEENTIEKNVTILKESIYPEENNSIMILAAHSGTGKIAYFEKLNELEVNDEIILNFKKKTYTYIVKNIWEEKKTGYINFNKEEKKQLILTTCSPQKSNYQLVINCIEKES